MALKTISYIYHDPDNTTPYWISYTEQFDDTVISVADKIAIEYNKRTAGKTAQGRLKAQRYFFDDSLIISDSSGGGSSINIYNTSSDLTSNREVNGSANEYYLKFISLSEFYAETSDGSSLQLADNATLKAGGLAQVLGNEIELKNETGQTNVQIANDLLNTDSFISFVNQGLTGYSLGHDVISDTLQISRGLFNADTLFTFENTGRARSRNDVVTWFDNSVFGTDYGGLGVNIAFNTSGWINDLNIFPKNFTRLRGTEVRAFGVANKLSRIAVAPSALNDDGIQMRWNDNGGQNLGQIYTSRDLELVTFAGAGARKITINAGGIPGRGFEHRELLGGAGRADFVFNAVPIYVDVATAQADPNLPLGGLYRTTFGGANNNSQLRIKQ